MLVNRHTRVLVQGITGGAGSFHARQMLDYGTQVVAGVTPGRGGQMFDARVPIFDTVAAAAKATAATASIIFVPAAAAADAMLEAVDAYMELVVCITEGIPVLDMVRVKRALCGTATRLIGPNCPGVITPGGCKIGIMPAAIHRPGRVAVVSRSGTLTYEAVHQLTQLGIGQSTCIGIGGDPIIGTTFVDALHLCNHDPDTDAVVMIGEIGGSQEESAARWAQQHMHKPMVAFIAGATAPPGRRMGHAGAIVSGGQGSAEEKYAALEAAGICITRNPAQLGSQLQALLKKAGKH